ncbi:hypothetical protein Tco_0966814 [Tanacetum coccineum]
MLPFFQAIGLEPFLTLNEPICPRFVVEFYHSLEVKRNEEDTPYIEFKLGQFTFKLTPSRILQTPHDLETFYSNEWSLNSLDNHPNSKFVGPKHDLVKKAITIPRTTQTQLLRDPNKLYGDDIRPDLKGWELFFKGGDISIALLTNDTIRAVIRNPSKEKGKNVISSPVISSSSSSSNENEGPSFLEFYDELSDSKDLTKSQQEKGYSLLLCVSVSNNLDVSVGYG